MKTTISSSSLPAAVLTAVLAITTLGQGTKSSAAEPLSAERTVLASITAKVEAIDLAKREITLKGPLGNVVTFVADKRIKRLNEVKVGDEVTADYYVSLAGELRAPTEDEKAHPLTMIEGGARAPKGAEPAGGVLRAFKVVATVVGLDLPTQTVTLEGPMGNTGTIRAEQVDKLKQLRLGDTIVVMYTEALAISLEKAHHPAKKE